MRKKESYEWWKKESEYIKSINPLNPPMQFNDGNSDVNKRRDCFASYCDMQARFVSEDGFPLMVKDMRDAADIAKFRGRKDATR